MGEDDRLVKICLNYLKHMCFEFSISAALKFNVWRSMYSLARVGLADSRCAQRQMQISLFLLKKCRCKFVNLIYLHALSWCLKIKFEVLNHL